MSEERDKKDDRQPDAGLPRVRDRRQVVPPGGRSPGSALRGVRLPPLPGPESSSASRRAQAGGRQVPVAATGGGAGGQSFRRAGLPAAAPRRSAAASGVCKLPALPAAASSTPSPRGRARAVGIRGSRLPVLAPRPPGTSHGQDGTAGAESRAPVLEVSAVLVPRHARSRQNCVVSLSCAAAASPRVGVQLAVPGCHAPTSSLRTPAGTGQGLFTKAGKVHAAWRDAQEGSRDARAATAPSSRAAQKGPEGQAGGRERDKEPLPALVPEDAGNLDSPKSAHSPEEANNAVLFPRVCDGGERDVTATTMPEVSGQALGAALSLQSPRGVNQEAYRCSPVHPAIWRIREEARKEQMLSSWNISWPNMSMLRLLRPQAAHASASATDSAQGMLDTCTPTSMVEGLFPVPVKLPSWDAGVRDEPHDLEEIVETKIAGQSSGDLQNACLALSDEAETVRSASLLGAGPGPAGHLEPLPASVPEDAEDETTHCPEEVNAGPLLLSACKREDEIAMYVLELFKDPLGETPKLPDARELYGETYGYSPIFPAIRRIQEEARKEQMLSSWNISWPGNESMLRLLRPQAAHDSAGATDTVQSTLDTCTVTSVVEGPIPMQGEFISWDAGVQDEQHDLEEIAETVSAGQSSGDLQSVCLAQSDEAHTVCSPSLLDADPAPAEHLEPLPASVLEDAESSDSSKDARSAENADAASLCLSVSEGEEAAMPVLELFKEPLGETPKLPDARELYGETYGYSPIFPAIRRIQEEARKEQMLSSWNISWPNNESMLRLLRPQAVHNSASATDTGQNMLDTCTTTSTVEGPFPVAGELLSWDAGMWDEQHDSEEIAETGTAGQSPGDLQNACLAQSDEAETVLSASLLGTGPGLRGHHEPLPTSVPENVEDSDCFTAAHSLEGASEAPFFLSLSEGEEREEPSMAMTESCRQSLGEPSILQDPGEMYWMAYGCPPVHPAIRRIREEARREQMLSARNMSEPYSAGTPRLLVLQAADDSANAADTAWGMLDIYATTPRADGHFPASSDSQSWDIGIKYASYAQEAIIDDAASDVGTDHSMLDARDTAVMAESMPTPSCFCPDTVEGVEEEWQDDHEEEAAEAAVVPPSISGSSCGEMKTAAARRRMPAIIRNVLRALRRVCTCSCIWGQREERHEAANTRQLPRD